jgi:hypothetical protein
MIFIVLFIFIRLPVLLHFQFIRFLNFLYLFLELSVASLIRIIGKFGLANVYSTLTFSQNYNLPLTDE